MDASVASDKELMRKLKGEVCSCNGVLSADGTIQMQGDHRDTMVSYLLSIGINRCLIIT